VSNPLVSSRVFTSLIKDRMADLNITQQNIAEELNVSKGFVADMIHGRRAIPSRLFPAFVEYLAIDEFVAYSMVGLVPNKIATRIRNNAVAAKEFTNAMYDVWKVIGND
jgi:predicted transcriptional regulator